MTTRDTGPGDREFAATDPERVAAYLTTISGTPVRFSARPGAHRRFRHVRTRLEPFHIDLFDHAGTTECRSETFPMLASVWMHGGLRTDVCAGERLGPGDVAVNGRPGESFHVRNASARYSAVWMPIAVAAEVVRNRPDDELGPLRFAGCRPVSPAAARQWRRTVDYVGHSVRTNPEAMAEPLVRGAATRLLAATMLGTFPNSWAVEPCYTDRTDAKPTTLSRAIAFIDANADTDIGPGDIARAACVTVRAVQLAFRRHLDTTPMAFLRQVRLQRAHDQLVAADPDNGITIAQVAARWGFADSSRFAARYRQAFGQPPSRTLRG